MSKLLQTTMGGLLIWTLLLFQFVESSSSTPKMEFRPLPPDSRRGSTLIWYNGISEQDIKHYTNSLDEFLSVYQIPGQTPGRARNIYNCDYNNLPPPGQVCDVDIKKFGPCVKENLYSYRRDSPCVILKLNEVYGWIPEYYNTSTNLPDNMPENLKHHIQHKEETRIINNVLWVSCDGKHSVDKEFVGPVNYFPSNGYPGYFFPYQNQEGYLSPLIAIHFERPQRGAVINIECKIWARNIVHDMDVGLVHFELLVD